MATTSPGLFHTSSLPFLLWLLLSLPPPPPPPTHPPPPPTSLLCGRLPHGFDPLKKDLTGAEHNSSKQTLFLDLTDVLYKFCSESVYNASGVLRLELVETKRKSLRKDKCLAEDPRSRVQHSVYLSPTNPVTIFRYVDGVYFIRLSECFGKNSRQCQVVACSSLVTLRVDDPRDREVCQSSPGPVAASEASDLTRLLNFRSTCSVSMRTVVPLCTPRQSYNRARVFTVEINRDSSDGAANCSVDDFLTGGGSAENTTIRVEKCRSEDVCQRDNATTFSYLGLLRHELHDLNRNKSYCVFYQVENPHCRMAHEKSGKLSCFFHTHKAVACGLFDSRPFSSLLTQPVFVGLVSLTLFISLALLMWTVVQCSRRRPETPIQQPIKKPPRSLTEDDLEHISRLPSQEIVLVYFPDTKRFKELNRKFRDWLITLDVNDVRDIYDEKCSEEVLKDPERWVRSALGGPEKRVILVCSRLAYECLLAVKRPGGTPKFAEEDPHFGLLTRAVRYLEREMRGNYRNLICVRYEDLKVCDRRYSSEAFNIVPGTEYVLPQHLEDVYRWIHPRDPRPECWSPEGRPEVRELLDAMRVYRLHDDNVFTVQFNANGNVAAPGASEANAAVTAIESPGTVE